MPQRRTYFNKFLEQETLIWPNELDTSTKAVGSGQEMLVLLVPLEFLTRFTLIANSLADSRRLATWTKSRPIGQVPSRSFLKRGFDRQLESSAPARISVIAQSSNHSPMCQTIAFSQETVNSVNESIE